MVEKLPRSRGAEVIAYQLLKSSSSVAANYRAVCRAKSKAYFINKLGRYRDKKTILRLRSPACQPVRAGDGVTLSEVEVLSTLKFLCIKLKIVEEESDESLFWLEFIADLELIHKELLEDLIKEANELVSIFTAALKTSKTNKS